MTANRGHKKQPHILRTILLGAIASSFMVGGVFVLWISSFKIPDLGGIEERKVSQSTKIYDRTGEVLLYDVHEDIKRTIVPFEEISRHIKNATVAIEDEEFYQHYGVKPMAFLRAVIANLGNLDFGQGGSTITQQVVKNTLLTTEKRISRKLKEWVLAVKLERVMDKESILSLYLNEAPYGGSMYGIQEASLLFFGKNASDINLAEAAYLAAIPNAPTYYSPYGNNRDALERRKNLVLERMLANNFITEEEYKQTLTEEVVFKPQPKTGILAPHFVLYVKELLEERYGARAVLDEGLRVITTLDYTLQEQAEEIVKRHALENEENYNAENAGLVAIDPRTGGILTMVGSRNYFDETIDGNFNVTRAKRQPGSAFKPFVYATALSKGYTPETTVFDLQTEFSTFCKPDGTPIVMGEEDTCYQPVNYDGVYHGPMTMREALAQSVNVPAIKFLYLAGLRDSLQVARDMGISTLENIDRYGLTLVLGGGEVTLLDITSAYGVFATGGVRTPYRAITEVYDQNGTLLEAFSGSPNQVIEKNVALQISDMLSDNTARTPAFGERSFLYFPGREVAAKTGTTNDYRDAWIIGYTPSIAVGAWAGNNDNSPMEKKVAGFIIAPLWNEFMQRVLASTSPNERFERPEDQNNQALKPVLRGFWRGNVSYFIDSLSGKLATEYTPAETKQERVITDVHSILHWVNRNNPRGPAPERPELDSQYEYWEYAVQKWVAEKNIVPETTAIIPTATDDIHVPEKAPKISVQGIDPTITYQASQTIALWATSQGPYPLTRVDVFLNDRFLGSSTKQPFIYTFTPSTIEGLSTINTIKLVGYDAVFNKSEAVATLKLSF